MAASRNFINNLSNDTGLVLGTGRYLIYSTNPTDSIEGMTGYNEHYNQTYTSGVVPAYAGTGNWFLYSYNPNGDTTPTTLNEQVTMALTRPNQTNVGPSSTGFTAPNSIGGKTVPVEIIQTGINVNGITTSASATPSTGISLPSTLQVTSVNEQSTAYSIVMAGQAVTVAMNSVNTASQPEQNSSIAVIRAGDETQTPVYYSATGSSESLTLVPTESSGKTVRSEETDNASETSFSVNVDGGSQAKFKGLYANGVLSIWALNESASGLLQGGSDSSKSVVAIGILVTQQNLDATIQPVETVYLH